MSAMLLVLVCGLGVQESRGLELERRVTRVSLDLLGRRQELRRQERLLIRTRVRLRWLSKSMIRARGKPSSPDSTCGCRPAPGEYWGGRTTN